MQFTCPNACSCEHGFELFETKQIQHGTAWVDAEGDCSHYDDYKADLRFDPNQSVKCCTCDHTGPLRDFVAPGVNVCELSPDDTGEKQITVSVFTNKADALKFVESQFPGVSDVTVQTDSNPAPALEFFDSPQHVVDYVGDELLATLGDDLERMEVEEEDEYEDSDRDTMRRRIADIEAILPFLTLRDLC